MRREALLRIETGEERFDQTRSIGSAFPAITIVEHETRAATSA